MENSKVYSILLVLNKWKRRSLEKFVQSAYLNSHEEVAVLYKILNDCVENNAIFPTKEAIYKKIHPKQTYNDQQLRLYMSYLFKTIEKFLIFEQIEEDPFLQKVKLMDAYNNLSQHKNFYKTYEDTIKIMDAFPYKNSTFYERYFDIETERYNEKRNLSRTAEYDFQKLTSNFDIYFLAEKMKQACMLVSHEQVHQKKYDYGFFDEILIHLENNNKLLDIPAIAIYYYIFQILKQHNHEENFEKLLNLINTHLQLFPKIEARDILIYANNYCIQMNNIGKDGYARKSFDINKIGIKSGAFLEKGFLSRFTYKNIVTVGIRLKEYKWTEKFIKDYIGFLEEKYQQSSLSYNKAYLEYERKNYDAAIKLLQKADYDDLLLNLAAKNILMKIYFELNYIEPLEYLIGSILALLKRKKLDLIYKNNYINIAKLTKRLITLKTMTASQRSYLKKKKEIAKKFIEESKPCSEKKWLLQQLEKIN
ncbi:MAG TPA: hypothetical protein PK431_00610 [Chitinophagales bacterium]|nr:hypothetical protein [Chitinophagales bacterium]